MIPVNKLRYDMFNSNRRVLPPSCMIHTANVGLPIVRWELTRLFYYHIPESKEILFNMYVDNSAFIYFFSHGDVVVCNSDNITTNPKYMLRQVNGDQLGLDYYNTRHGIWWNTTAAATFTGFVQLRDF